MLSISLFLENLSLILEGTSGMKSKIVKAKDGKTYEVFNKTVRVNGKMVTLNFRREIQLDKDNKKTSKIKIKQQQTTKNNKGDKNANV